MYCVDNPESYATFSSAVIAQLNAEITAAGMNRATLARQIGMDYGTLGRYLKDERDIPILVLYAIVDRLPIDEATLFTRARERFEQQR